MVYVWTPQTNIFNYGNVT